MAAVASHLVSSFVPKAAPCSSGRSLVAAPLTQAASFRTSQTASASLTARFRPAAASLQQTQSSPFTDGSR